MSSNNTDNNPILQRIDILRNHWFDFVYESDAKICRWLINSDELQLIDAFIEMESDEAGETEDLFIMFDTPFAKKRTYSQDLVGTLISFAEINKEELSKDGIYLNWEPPRYAEAEPVSDSFLEALSSFATSFDFFGDGCIVAYLSPQEIESVKDLEKWFTSWIESRVPEKVRIMICDSKSEPIFKEALEDYPAKIKTIEPNLEMGSVMRQLAANGNSKEPGTRFRQLFVDMSQAASQKRFSRMEDLGEKAIELANKQNAPEWKSMHISVYLLMGNAYLGAKEYSKALESYEEGELIARAAFKEEMATERSGDTSYPKILIQLLFSFAGTLEVSGKSEKATEKYLEVIPITEALVSISKGNETLEATRLRMEAFRMAAVTSQKKRKYVESRNYNELALVEAEKYREVLLNGKGIFPHDRTTKQDAAIEEQIERMAREMFENSTIPYLGRALLKDIRNDGDHEDEVEVRKRLSHLLGANWEEKFKERNNL